MDSALDACTTDLYTADDILRQKYPEEIVAKISRIRALHQWFLSNPSASDAQCVRECCSRFAVSRPTAYSDLRILKTLLPHLSQASKDFSRWRYNQMILETYDKAKNRSDTRTMERAASSFARYNNLDQEDKQEVDVDQLATQPFIATDDPSVLGIKKIPNIRERQKKLLEKYLQESADIEDIDFEPVDLEEETLFPDSSDKLQITN